MQKKAFTKRFNDIKDAVKMIPTIDVVQRYGAGPSVTRQHGRNVCLCPFHAETSPSFVVYDYSYKCYGCGEAGDNIAYVMKSFGLKFRDAVFLLAKDYGYYINGEEDVLSPEKRNEIETRRKETDSKKAIQLWRNSAHRAIVEFRDELRAGMPYISEKHVNLLPFLEWWLDILAVGSDEDVQYLKESKEFGRWFETLSDPAPQRSDAV